jgi:hypothetical protein
MTLGRNTFMDQLPNIINRDIRVCVECSRVFNLTNADDAQEWHYGHDCEGE